MGIGDKTLLVSFKLFNPEENFYVLGSFSISESVGSSDIPMVANICVPICAAENPIACEIRISCCDQVSSIVTAEYSVDS